MNEKMSQDIKEYKILILSLTGAGKTCIIHRFVRGYYQSLFLPSIGVNLTDKYVKLNHGKAIKMVIIDTSGAEKFRCICQRYYKESHGIILI